MGLASFNRMRREQAAKAEGLWPLDQLPVNDQSITRVEEHFNGQLRADDIKYFLDIAGIKYGNKAKKSDLIQLFANSKHEGVL